MHIHNHLYDNIITINNYVTVYRIYIHSVDQRQTMGPFAFPRNANLAWQDIHNSKLPETQDFMLKPPKAFNKIVTMLSDDSKGIGSRSTFPGCSITSKSSLETVFY